MGSREYGLYDTSQPYGEPVERREMSLQEFQVSNHVLKLYADSPLRWILIDRRECNEFEGLGSMDPGGDEIDRRRPLFGDPDLGEV